MPFILDISHDNQHRMELIQNDFESIARIAIGHDPHANIQYSIAGHLLMLDPFEGASNFNGIYNSELMFSVVEHNGTTARFIDDGRQTQCFLEGEHRRIALEVICFAWQALLEERRLDLVSFATATPNMPQKAVLKYNILCETVCDSGYVGGEADQYEGNRIWMFTKSPSTA